MRGQGARAEQHQWKYKPSRELPVLNVCYPGSEDFTLTLPGQQLGYGCLPPTAFNLGELILDFFDRHPRSVR